jgi:dCTP deaminase
MILSAKSIRERGIVSPFHERTVHNGMSFGLSLAGYDVRVNVPNGKTYIPARGVELLATIESFAMPLDVVGILHPKSTWVRRGLSIPSVVLEPGWRVFLTLVLQTAVSGCVEIHHGDPIAQIVFHQLDDATGPGYTGKYQGQGPDPTPARKE